MRKLKYHEKKLLKKVDFLSWKREGGHREAMVMQRYHVTGRDDYKKYSSVCRTTQKMVNMLKQMNPNDPTRIELTDKLLEKLIMSLKLLMADDLVLQSLWTLVNQYELQWCIAIETHIGWLQFPF
ncbi:hypothetical protein ACLB2K_061966 [Fragaria x ananassa]